MRTYDNRFTMAEWWELTKKAQVGGGEMRLLSQFVNPGDLVFDVGANRGIMTLVFRQLGATVVAIEPLFKAAPHLVREFHWKFSDDPDVIAIDKAVSDKIQTIQISVQKNLPYLSSCDQDWMTKSAHRKMYAKRAIQPTKVRTTTFDQLIDLFGHPDFVKLDVEGYESTAILGLTQPVKAMSFEFHEDWLDDAQKVVRHLNSLGKYEYNYALDNRGVLIFDKWVKGTVLIHHLRNTLTKSGKGSWGDGYARLIR